MRLRSPGLGAVCVMLLGCLALAAAENADLIVKNVRGVSFNITQLRKKLHYESMAERLAHETKHLERRLPAPKEAKALWQRLAQSDKRLRFETDIDPKQGVPFGQEPFGRHAATARADSLRILHTKEVEDFVKRNGFGADRAPFVSNSPRFWETPVADPITLKKLPDENNSAGVVLPPKDPAAYREMRWPAVPSLLTFHDRSMYNFVDPIGFGHIKDREHVSGFQAHHFRSLPEMPVDPNAKVKERWLINRLELVGLLKHDKPAVYVSEALPRMQDLGKKKTRPLSDFEESALQGLTKGEDLVAEASANRIVMLGSIRAGDTCLKCHDAKRGDLLGSFSYELRRDPPLEVKK
jgi:hypothetical protein